jgi:2,4-dienoyl-CoA reductase-like NADH-dependent reductase (Old Yellow Enzyme family)
MSIETGYVACNYSEGDTLGEVERGEIRKTFGEAQSDANALGLEGVRYVHADGYLYVDAQQDAP